MLDVVRTLVVIGAIVAAVYLLLPRSDGERLPPVDVDGAVQVAEAAGDVPVVVPLTGDRWEVTSARREQPTEELDAWWHLGYLTPAQEYAGLEVTDAATQEWVTEVTNAGTEAGAQDVDGVAWTVFESFDPDRTSLVLLEGSRGTVVTGGAPLDELVQLARAATANSS